MLHQRYERKLQLPVRAKRIARERERLGPRHANRQLGKNMLGPGWSSVTPVGRTKPDPTGTERQGPSPSLEKFDSSQPGGGGGARRNAKEWMR